MLALPSRTHALSLTHTRTLNPPVSLFCYMILLMLPVLLTFSLSLSPFIEASHPHLPSRQPSVTRDSATCLWFDKKTFNQFVLLEALFVKISWKPICCFQWMLPIPCTAFENWRLVFLADILPSCCCIWRISLVLVAIQVPVLLMDEDVKPLPPVKTETFLSVMINWTLLRHSIFRTLELKSPC